MRAVFGLKAVLKTRQTQIEIRITKLRRHALQHGARLIGGAGKSQTFFGLQDGDTLCGDLRQLHGRGSGQETQAVRGMAGFGLIGMPDRQFP